jgi:hypothetical protein
MEGEAAIEEKIARRQAVRLHELTDLLEAQSCGVERWGNSEAGGPVAKSG